MILHPAFRMLQWLLLTANEDSIHCLHIQAQLRNGWHEARGAAWERTDALCLSHILRVLMHRSSLEGGDILRGYIVRLQSHHSNAKTSVQSNAKTSFEGRQHLLKAEVAFEWSTTSRMLRHRSVAAAMAAHFCFLCSFAAVSTLLSCNKDEKSKWELNVWVFLKNYQIKKKNTFRTFKRCNFEYFSNKNCKNKKRFWNILK